jgi:hypothetical protein
MRPRGRGGMIVPNVRDLSGIPEAQRPDLTAGACALRGA